MHSEAGFGKSRQLAALNALSVGYPPPLFSPKQAAAFGVKVRQGPVFRALRAKHALHLNFRGFFDKAGARWCSQAS